MHLFKGFDDWIEVFEGGWQTDSQGRRRYWSEQELDQIVANHNAEDPFPAVIGHPKTDDPAYGWGAALRRQGMKLLAKFNEIEPNFAKMVETGRFKKRSAAIAKNKAGEFYMRHVGWLGAAAPAVEGLAHPTFSSDAEDVFEFQVDWRTPSLLGRTLRRLREWIISEHDVETADQHIPEHLVEEAQYLVDDAKRDPNSDNPDFAAQFSQHDNGDSTVPKPKDGSQPGSDTKTFTQADIDAAVQAERDRLQGDLEKERRDRRRQEYAAFVEELKLPPAITAGMSDFMLQLADADDSQFEFSIGEGDKAEKKKQTPLAWFKAHIGQFKGKFDHLFEERGNGEDDATSATTYEAPAGYTVDPDALELHNKAMEYMQNHNGVEYVQAVQIVERQGA